VYALCSTPFLLEKCGGNLELQLQHERRRNPNFELFLGIRILVGSAARQFQSAANVAFASWTPITAIIISPHISLAFKPLYTTRFSTADSILISSRGTSRARQAKQDPESFFQRRAADWTKVQT
jgi:hypothetical protein